MVKPRGSFLNQKVAVSTTVTLLVAFLWLPFSESVAISNPFEAATPVRVGIRLAFLFLVFSFLYYALEFVERFLGNSIRHRLWAKSSLVALAIFSFVLLLTWPGYFVLDEYHILQLVRLGYIPDGQTIITSLLYTFYLYLVPSGSFFAFFQILIVATVCGYVVSATQSALRINNHLFWTVGLVFLLPSSILMALYPLRLTVYACILMAVLFRIILVSRKSVEVENLFREVFWLSFGIALLVSWRSEGLIFVVLVPVVFLTIWPLASSQRFRVFAPLALMSLLLVGTVYSANSHYSNPRYPLTAIINPLSAMLQGELSVSKDSSDLANLATLDRFIDVQLVGLMPSVTEIPSFWAGAARPASLTKDPAPYQAFLGIVWGHPIDFLEARWGTFLATNRLPANFAEADWNGQITAVKAFTGNDAETSELARSLIASFETNNKWALPLNDGLRNLVVRLLLMVDEEARPSPFSQLAWNVIAGVVMGVLGGLISVFRRDWLVAGILSLLAAAEVLVFLTAPAAFFMYYFPYTLGGMVLFVFKVIESTKFHSGLRRLQQGA